MRIDTRDGARALFSVPWGERSRDAVNSGPSVSGTVTRRSTVPRGGTVERRGAVPRERRTGAQRAPTLARGASRAPEASEGHSKPNEGPWAKPGALSLRSVPPTKMLATIPTRQSDDRLRTATRHLRRTLQPTRQHPPDSRTARAPAPHSAQGTDGLALRGTPRRSAGACNPWSRRAGSTRS